MTAIPRHLLDAQQSKESPDQLNAFLCQHRGSDAEIDVAGVSTFGGRLIELILIAERQWQADGRKLCLINHTPELAERMTGFGLPARLFSNGG